MKNFTAWGIVVNDQLKAVFLEKYYAGRECAYYRHLGTPLVVELQVTEQSLQDIQRQLDDAQQEEDSESTTK